MRQLTLLSDGNRGGASKEGGTGRGADGGGADGSGKEGHGEGCEWMEKGGGGEDEIDRKEAAAIESAICALPAEEGTTETTRAWRSVEWMMILSCSCSLTPFLVPA